ncbi:bifunctional UDP-N-acetylmuramoyl-tripeptide:D-alanyl-D-alanine ligase/alanine racemase [Mangrovivirga sp. M17]|uniref:Alanine racemase n=1 Tax=Mangrovivirga halotolerans TaxID=2993936 RepID=A0ABT3RS16_9BACT|nr:bifunctional UDP-N-acetylmuramoyl-tripeptide:D-alanyl-D-alanine ligase/alanine racemase [Mangrovivirga halotolerans]MCX2744578.1 bifunctional UDP-N-acetylmuramoyl-tripeptide:D-alanyl-D-alanine ligase/alanine racemase [Mangrovivirga halotolerans]
MTDVNSNETNIPFSDLKKVIDGEILNLDFENRNIKYLITDSRRPIINPESVFFAIKGNNHDGHNYIPSMIESGIKQFIIEDQTAFKHFKDTDCNVCLVKSSVKALQDLASYKRSLTTSPVIAITGSNGKTIIKEWVSQLLYDSEKVIQSPMSYNSQIGVPVSVWGIESFHTVGVFEAGISHPGEMKKLQEVIKPTHGIFANIGSAHESNFESIEQKANEKAILFQTCERITYCKDHEIIHNALTIYEKSRLNGWSANDESADYFVSYETTEDNFTNIIIYRANKKSTFTVKFNDPVSLENITHCLVCLIDMGYKKDYLKNQLPRIKEVDMRLTIKRGINQSFVIDDTYNNDMAGLEAALSRVTQFPNIAKRIVVLSDIQQSAATKEELYGQVSRLLESFKIDQVIAIGNEITQYLKYNFGDKISFQNTEEALNNFGWDEIEDSLIIVKGGRVFQLEKIVRRLEKKIHGTTLEINLSALTNNLNFYRSKIKPGVKLMVMVKALAYGSGAVEIGKILQFHRVDYLAVAYPDEGVNLRRNGIYIPIMVMNPSPESFDMLHRYDLEPEVYSLSFLKKLDSYTREEKKSFKVHVKLDTGMHRLGFNIEELKKVIEIISANKYIRVTAAFSHLAGADSSSHNEFSHQQNDEFKKMSEVLIDGLGHNVIRHLCNSAGIIRFPEFQYDMVRLGIGLYGVEVTEMEQKNLLPISKLKTIVSQVKAIKKGQTVGYGRAGVAAKDMKIATIAIGYADGFSRIFSQGNASVYIKGVKVPVFGNVCMDMTMVDVTAIDDINEGDEVVIFETTEQLLELAESGKTIPYEILTNVSERVKRVFQSI